MIYKILYDGGNASNYANGAKDLQDWIKLLKEEEINDILKIYKDGREISVLERYQEKINRYK